MSDDPKRHRRWAEFRFSVVGPLLAAPPEHGELRQELERLAEKTWCHPVTGEPIRYSRQTIERWYYRARSERGSPVEVLRRKFRSDSGRRRRLSPGTAKLLGEQYEEHSGWSYKLHADNLRVTLEGRAELTPSYSTVRRYMQAAGLEPQRRRRRGVERPGERAARWYREKYEVRSFEVEYPGALWHLDFHHGSREVLCRKGTWKTPICLAVLDDYSRLACHAQWYFAEGARELTHGYLQALQKRGVPRALLTDNGSAMLSEEFTAGLLRLGTVHETTLPYSAYQNGKQERFWSLVEGRLLAMLDGVRELSLGKLNEATLAWAEMEYNRLENREISSTPLDRYLTGENVSRPSPSSEELRLAFRREVKRVQRRKDGSISLHAKRFEVPSRFRTLREIWIRYAEWDLSSVHLVDPRTGKVLSPLYPLNKAENARSGRRAIASPQVPQPEPGSGAVAPLLRKLLAEYAATGLPPAYLPTEDE